MRLHWTSFSSEFFEHVPGLEALDLWQESIHLAAIDFQHLKHLEVAGFNFQNANVNFAKQVPLLDTLRIEGSAPEITIDEINTVGCQYFRQLVIKRVSIVQELRTDVSCVMTLLLDDLCDNFPALLSGTMRSHLGSADRVGLHLGD